MTSSHFCTAERQYRMPVPYGSQRTPTAQWTATASGCCLLGAEKTPLAVTAVTCGRIVDLGVTDANNMGAAMAPAAFDTLQAHFTSTGTTPADYDLVLTGDLGVLGHQIGHGALCPGGREHGEQLPGLRHAALRHRKAGYARRCQRLRLLGLGAVRLPAG